MREWWAKLRGFPGRDRLDADLREEMAAHLEMAIEDRIERGLPPLEARDEAQRRFGNQTLIQESSREAWMFRSLGNPAALAPAVRSIVQDADAAQAVSDVRLLDDIVATQTAPRRDQLAVLGAFAAIAFLLAAIGIHGLLSFTVSSRLQEIGVRVALGAARSAILRMFLNQGLTLGIAGIAIAAPLAYLAARAMKALLFGVEPGDPLIYVSAAALAIVMTLAGSLRPAIRAATIDPALTIRAE